MGRESHGSSDGGMTPVFPPFDEVSAMAVTSDDEGYILTGIGGDVTPYGNAPSWGMNPT